MSNSTLPGRNIKTPTGGYTRGSIPPSISETGLRSAPNQRTSLSSGQTVIAPENSNRSPVMPGKPNSPSPSGQPIRSPSPSGQPIRNPPSPSDQPIRNPPSPSDQPIRNPPSPSGQPIRNPPSPSGQPIRNPTSPSGQPIRNPTSPSGQPIRSPSPSGQPIRSPSPSGQPIRNPTSPSGQPIRSPSPSGQPIRSPSPSGQPIRSPSPSGQPIRSPSPSGQPIRSPSPSGRATRNSTISSTNQAPTSISSSSTSGSFIPLYDLSENIPESGGPRVLTSDQSSSIIPSSVLADHDETTIDDLVSQLSLVDLLAEHRYTVLEKICVLDDSRAQVKFLKASNVMGQTIFIEVDLEGYVSSTDTFYRRVEMDNGLPASIKTGTISSVYSELYGIVFPCSNAYVVTYRTSSPNNPQEVNYLQDGQKSMKDCGLYLPYPLVRLSDLKSNPQEIFRQTDRATKNIQNHYFTQAFDQLNAVEEMAQELVTNIGEFRSKVMEYAKHLKESTETIRRHNMIYLNGVSVNQDNQDKPRYIQWNLRRRFEMGIFLISELQRLHHSMDTLSSLSQFLKEDLSTRLDQEFCYVHLTIPEDL